MRLNTQITLRKVSKLMEKPIPKTQLKLYGLDHLRALAILLVLGFHYQRFFAHPSWTNWFNTMGWTGVDLFFVLSGFLISSQLFGPDKKRGRHFVKDVFYQAFFLGYCLYIFL